MKKRVADIVVETLSENGITDCFMVVGGGAMHLDNAFFCCEKINKVFNHHEQASSMCAESYARYSGKMAAVCVTSGPGGTNAINGVQGAWADSIPMIVISGFPRWETSALSTGLDLRTRGVQENDIISMVKGITKYAVRVLNPLTIREEVQYAIDIALDGRRGPVWIEVPLNIQGMVIDADDLYNDKVFSSRFRGISVQDLDYLNDKLKASKRPCILTGSGLRSGGCVDEFRSLVEKMNIPVVGGYLQGDICYQDERNFCGISGSPGSRGANFILQSADLIVVFGNSMSTYQTGFNQEEFAPNACIIMIDAQEDEAKKSGLHIDKLIHATLEEFFKKVDCLEKPDVDQTWQTYCREISEKYTVKEVLDAKRAELRADMKVPQMVFWEQALDILGEKAVFALGNSTCIVGGLLMGVRYPEQRILVNYKCGSMGHDLPNAIGAAIAGKREVYCITGDGSIMMNLQELQTINHNKLLIKVVVFSNAGYNAIRNTCRRYFHEQYIGCDENTGVSFPRFDKVAGTFDMSYRKCSKIEELQESLRWLKQQESASMLEIEELRDEIGSPVVASVMNEQGEFITPALHIMTPLLSESEIENNLFGVVRGINDGGVERE